MSVFRQSSSLLLYLLAAIVIFIAVAFSLLRLAIPYADDFRRQIQATISKTVGREVRIDEIDASWRHFKPRIELAGVTIALADERTVEFGKVSLGIDLIGSVVEQRLVSNEIRLASFELFVTEGLDGRFSLAGLSATEKRADTEQYKTLLSWVSRQQQVVIENGTVYFTSEKRPELLRVFSRLGVYIVNSDRQQQLSMQVDLPSVFGGKIELVTNFNGLPLLQGDWVTDSYLSASNISFAGLAAELAGDESGKEKIKGGNLNFELWASIGSDQSIDGRGHMTLKNLRLDANPSSQSGGEIIFSQASADFAVQKIQQEWAMAFAPLRIARAGASEQLFDLQLLYNDDIENRSLLVKTGGFRLNGVLDLVRSSPFISAAQLAQLEKFRVRGDVTESLVRWRPRGEAALSAYAAFENLSLAPSDTLPGADELQGYVHYLGNHGQLVLSGSESTIDAAQWFREPLRLENLAMDLAWVKQQDGITVDIKDIALSNSDLALAGEVAAFLPAADEASPYVDMQFALERANIAKRSLYLPGKIMPAKSLQWYERALKSGELSRGQISLQGPLAQFPFKNGEGLFAIDARIDKAELEYKPDWPVLKNIAADLRIRNASIELLADKGTMFDTHLTKARMSVADFTLKPVTMEVTGAAQGQTSDALTFLAQSPLKKRFEKSLEVLTIEGKSELALRLDIPIPGKVNVSGELAITDNRLTVSDNAFVADDINGMLRFDNKGLHGEGIAADILGMRALVDIEPVTEGDKPGTKFTGTGHGDVETYAKLSHLPWLAEFATGSSDWKAQVSIIGGNPELTLETDLVGVASRFPHPFAKPLEQSTAFSMSTVLPFGSETVTMSYGSNMHAELEMDDEKNGDNRLSLLNVGLGGPPARLVAGSKGVFINGELDQLVLNDWITALASLAGGAKQRDSLSVMAELQLGQLEVFGYQWQNVKTRMQHSQDRWDASINGEGISGDVVAEGVMPDMQLTLAMNELALRSVERPAEAKDIQKPDLDPRQLPTVEVWIKQLNYDAFNLGEFAFKTRKIKQGQQIEDLVVRAPTFSLLGAGNWVKVAEEQRSSFNIDLEAADLAKLIGGFGYADDNVEGGETRLNANVYWQGLPTEYEHKKLNGQLKLLVNNIHFSNIDPGAGRVFGLLSVQALPQRLSLDFSDLFKKGLQINKIEGSFSIKNGDAVTNDLFMQGAAARIDIAGRIGLADQDYDQVMAVTPEVSSSLPLVGAAVGGPAGAGVGTAILFLHKLFNPKILNYKYQVTGPWRDPKVVLLKNTPSGAEQQQKVNPNNDDNN